MIWSREYENPTRSPTRNAMAFIALICRGNTRTLLCKKWSGRITKIYNHVKSPQWHQCVENQRHPTNPRCNKSLGGDVAKYSPNKFEIDYAKKIIETISLEYLTIFSRIDFAYHNNSPKLIEAELLNPSAFAIMSGEELNFSKKFVNHLDKLMMEHSKKWR